MRWSDALVEFEQYLQESGLAANTVAGYVHDMRMFVSWLERQPGPILLPDTFTPAAVEAYKQHLVELNRPPSSINRYMQSVRKFGRFTLATGLRDSNPGLAIRLVPKPAGDAPSALTIEDQDRLLRVINAPGMGIPDQATDALVAKPGTTASSSPPRELRSRSALAARDRLIVLLLLRTGIRVSELVDLHLNEVDLSPGRAAITVAGQGGRPERRLPLQEPERQLLEVYVQAQLRREGIGRQNAGSPTQDHPIVDLHLFRARDGSALSVRSVQQIVADLGRLAGLDITATTLRHTYAVSLWQTTGDLMLLATRLGHLRPETVLKYLVMEQPQPAGGAGPGGFGAR